MRVPSTHVPLRVAAGVLAIALAATGCGSDGGGGGGRSGGSSTPGGATGGATPGPQPPLRAGTAVVDVTPPVGVPLGGFGEGDRRLSFPDLNPFDWHTLFAPSEGVRDPILAKALVLDDGTDRVAIVTIDTVACSADAFDKVAAKLAARGVPIGPSNLVIAASHTHSGPGTLTSLHFWEVAAMDFYQPQVADRFTTGIADAVEQANARLEPAHIGIGKDRLPGVTKNRRAGVSPVYTRQSVDDELFVIRVDRASDGAPIATLWNFAIHGLVMWWDNMRYSADVMGDASRFVEANVGGTALFANGAEGDINPDLGKGDQDCRAGGQRIGQAVIDLRARTPATDGCDIRVASEVLDMGEPHLYLDWARVGGSVPASLQQVIGFFGLGFGAAIPLGRSLMDREFRYTAIRLRDAVIATVPGEPIHELGIEIKQAGSAFGFDPVMVFGLSNGHGAYFTTFTEYMAGGYEGLATLYGPYTGQMVRDECAKLMGAVR